VVVKVATPFCSTALPIAAAPLLKVTVPVAAAGVTVAVNITLCPGVEGFRLDVRVVVVEAACCTASEMVDDKLRLSVASPSYTAVTRVVPGDAGAVHENVATPPTNGAQPMSVA
jgi:hypothetical protein